MSIFTLMLDKPKQMTRKNLELHTQSQKKERIGSNHLNFHYILEFTSNFIINFPL